jgi:hypothetical protein
MFTTLLIIWIWLSEETHQLIAPLCAILFRWIFHHRKNSPRLITSVFCTIFIFTLFIWLISSKELSTAIFFGLRSATSAIAVIHLLPDLDRLINRFSICLPIIRDVLFILSRWTSNVVDILDDIKYTHSVEIRRMTMPKRRIYISSIKVATRELVELIERMTEVVNIRGNYPKLRKWLLPAPIDKKALAIDCFLMMISSLHIAYSLSSLDAK